MHNNGLNFWIVGNLILGLFLPIPFAWSKPIPYTTSGECDGFPAIALKTPPGVCVGIVADGFKFTRGLLALKDGKILVVDMGGWARKKGSLWLLEPKGKTFAKRKILDGLDEPHGLAQAPSGEIFIGELTEISRMHLDSSGAVKDREILIKGLPPEGLHSLRAIAYSPSDHSLYVDFGSKSDHCEADGKAPAPDQVCAEAEGPDARGGIWKYNLKDAGGPVTSSHLYAKGLRNSVAIAIHPKSGKLLDAENARDAINRADPKLDDEELPHERLSDVIDGGNYGWPYCYDIGVASPEFPKYDCSKFTKPLALMPAHVAPLGMTFYSGSMFPAWYQGKMLITYHGYRAYGHRLVAVPVNDQGVPESTLPGQMLDSYDVVSGWDKNEHAPLGSPVSVVVANDGSILLSEDHNGTVLRLFYDPKLGNGLPEKSVYQHAKGASHSDANCLALSKKTTLFSQIERDLIDVNCVSCHGNAQAPAGGLLMEKCADVENEKRWSAKKNEVLKRLQGGIPGFPQMPPGGGVSPELISYVKTWVESGGHKK